MKKIVIAGAGAYFFAPAIFEDLFVRFRMEAEYWMVDADLDMAELSARGAQALARAFGVQARFYYTTQLQKAAFSADAVILCSDFLDEEAWKKDFESLCEAARKRGIRIVLDGVFNHTGADSVYFDKFGNYGTAEKYRSWFRFGDQYRHGYECWWDVPDLPNVEENDPSFREFLCGEDGVVRRWLRRGASGWRLDVADELPDSLIRDIRAAMKEEKEDSLLLGEVWEDASNKVSYGALREYFLGSELDATMHYPFRTAVLDFLLGKIRAQAACDAFWTIQEHYPKENLYAALNLIGSHDRARVLTVLGGDVNALKMAMFLQFALPGVPSIYYGDEAGMTGGTDPYNRGSFPWGKGNAPLTDFVRSLTAMYQETPLLRRGECEMLFFGENVLGCRRFDESGSVLALVNRGEEAVECFGVTVPGRGYVLE